jgi:hypothetical protein
MSRSRFIVGLLFLVGLLMPAARALADDPPAVALLRWDQRGPYIKIFLTRPPVDGERISTTILSDGAKIADNGSDGGLTLRLTAAPTSPAVAVIIRLGTRAPEEFVVDVGTDLKFKVLQSPACHNALALLVQRNEKLPPSALDYANRRLREIYEVLGGLPTQMTLQIDPADRPRIDAPADKGGDNYQVTVRRTQDEGAAVRNGAAQACLATGPQPLPTGEFDARLVIPSGVPEIGTGVVATELTLVGSADAPTVFGSGDDAPGDRSFERNLDVALLGTSSLTKPDDGHRTRESVATLDLRIAPWLNALVPGRRPASRTLRYITPVYVDAKVSTGPLNKDTTSLNTIVIGSEFEFRHFPSKLREPLSFHRYVLRFSNAANRDFSHVETGGAVDWKPVLAAITRPRSLLSPIPRAFDDDPDRPAKLLLSTFGFAISPVAGIEFGGTSRWKSPPQDIENPSDFVRLHVGTDAKFEFGDRLMIDATLQAYVRSEAPSDRVATYLKVSAGVPLGSSTTLRGAAFFVSYERGILPPFDGSPVSTFKVGVRFQSDGWHGQVR